MPALLTHILPELKYSELVYVEGGPFEMEGKHLKVPSFAMGKYPVTQDVWEAVMLHNPARFKDPHRPVERVSWDDAQAFLQKLNQECASDLPTGCGYRLPSEAQWEYAAQGGKLSQAYTYAGGNDLDKVGWYDQNSHEETKEVGLKLPNELGLYDMNGNVEEWCEDQWHENYEGAPTDGSAWTDLQQGPARVIRGGSWVDSARLCRSTDRFYDHPTDRDDGVGFRVVLFFPPGSWTVHSK